MSAPSLHRLIKNLITKATTADDVLDKDGNIIKEGTGDLSAIQEILIGETRPPTAGANRL
jgi:hypothetical protein